MKVERLRVGLNGLETGRNPLRLSADAAQLELERWFKAATALGIEGSIDRFGETYTLRVRARVDVEETCGRCGRAFTHPLEEEVLIYADRRGADEGRVAEDLERDGHLVYHDGVTLDITEPVREALILSVPISPLCRPDCRGLCPGCGADLNVEECRCMGERVDSRWSALGRLKEKES